MVVTLSETNHVHLTRYISGTTETQKTKKPYHSNGKVVCLIYVYTVLLSHNINLQRAKEMHMAEESHILAPIK